MTDSEWDRAAAYELGAARPDVAWVLTDRDCWHRNCHYIGPPVPHPEDDPAEDAGTTEPVIPIEDTYPDWF